MQFLRALAASVIAVLTVTGCVGREAAAPKGPAWMADRARQQRALAKKSSVAHDFRFTDAIGATGITFVNQIVDDAGRTYKAVHYDHGMGVCAADVDRDGLTDLLILTQLGENQLWKNDGGSRFTNISGIAGIGMKNAVSVGCAFADVDNDGLPDLFVSTVRHGNRLFHNAGGGKFEDVTARAGVGYSGHSAGALFFDYDGDGLLDLFVANVGNFTTDEKLVNGVFVGREDAFEGHLHPDRAEASILYRNVGQGRFRDVTKETGLVDKSWSGEATVIDVNDDGFPDLYVASMQGGENHLWMNDHGQRFTNESAAWFPRTPWGAMGLKVFDFNGDGALDLFVTDMHSDMFGKSLAPEDWAGEMRKSDPALMPSEMAPRGHDRTVHGNALFAKRAASAGASPGFDEVSDQLGVESYWPWGPSVDDLNADGWDDIFITGGMSYPFRYSTNSLLLNEGGKHFLPAEFTLGVEPRADGETAQIWFTLNCMGGGADFGSKLCAACAQPNFAEIGCRKEDDGGRTIMGSKSSRSSVIFDVDNDGDLDIVTNEFNARPMVLLSDLAAPNTIRFLKVRLSGVRSNRQGVGALVTLLLRDGTRRVKAMDGKSGYLSQSDLPLYFGLGKADVIASIEVRWPGGGVQQVKGPFAANQLLEIVEQ